MSFPVLLDPLLDPNFTCDVLDLVYTAAIVQTLCFNIYHITDTCPFLTSQLGIVHTGD